MIELRAETRFEQIKVGVTMQLSFQRFQPTGTPFDRPACQANVRTAHTAGCQSTSAMQLLGVADRDAF